MKTSGGNSRLTFQEWPPLPTIIHVLSTSSKLVRFRRFSIKYKCVFEKTRNNCHDARIVHHRPMKG